MKSWLRSAILLVSLGFLLTATPSALRAGRGDFRGYWSTSYLLAHSENFADGELILDVQRQHTGWQRDFPVFTWNPPWVLVILIPFALVGFERAAWWWLLTNIALAFAASVLLWQVRTTGSRARRLIWLALLITFSFSPTLVVLLSGQMSLLVWFGLAAFLYFWANKKDGRAGLALVLTMAKPHLIYVTLPLVLLQAVWLRRWRTPIGFTGGLLGLTAVVFLLRPGWLVDYSQTVGQGNLLGWLTPTLGGAVDAAVGWQWLKLMAVVVLPFAVGVWWWHRRTVEMQDLLDITILVSVITAPFGWSYDFTILLMPVFRLYGWIVEGSFSRLEAAVLVAAYVAAALFSLYQRVIASSEVVFFWLPLVIAGLYLIARKRARRGEFQVSIQAQRA